MGELLERVSLSLKPLAKHTPAPLFGASSLTTLILKKHTSVRTPGSGFKVAGTIDPPFLRLRRS